MPKDRKRKNMLIIACIMLFATLFTLVPAFSFCLKAGMALWIKQKWKENAYEA